MKRIKTIALFFALAVTLAGCTSRNDTDSTTVAPFTTVQTTEATTAQTTEQTTIDSSSDVEGEKTSAAMSADFKEIGTLDNKAQGWGPGGPVDKLNRSQGAIAFQEKYGKYNSYFIAPSEGNKVYLTFDEGYEYQNLTASILDTLKKKEVSGVFFLTGHYAKTNPELVQRMIDEGHIVGNHSDKHKNFSQISLEEQKKDVQDFTDYMKENFNYTPTLFRFPEGAFTEQSLALVNSMGYKTLFWSFAYKDWEVDNQPNADEAFGKMTEKAHPGAIYLLHTVSTRNAELLGRLIDHLQGSGYTVAKFDL